LPDLVLGLLLSEWDSKKEKPRYKALYSHIRQLILSGVLDGGCQMPPSRLLAERLNLSRNTVMQALDMLQGDGFLISRQGAGVFVNDNFQKPEFISTHAPEDIDLQVPTVSKRAEKWLVLAQDRHVGKNTQAFAPGRTALDEFPFDKWARLLSRRWRLSGKKLAMVEDAMGYLPLRAHLADHLSSTRGVRCHGDQIMIVSGAQQGLDVISRVLWEGGDRIVVEDPSFDGIAGVIEGAGAQLQPVPIDQDGIMLETLEDGHDVKSFIVTPSRNYPMGVTMSLQRRIELLRRARSLGAWVVEDDFDCDFRFDGPPLTSLQSLDQDGRVIYIGTFSRIVFPALRLGFLVLPEKLVPAFCAAKSFIDGHASILHQAALADFMEEGAFTSHLRRMKKMYAQRRSFLTQKIEEMFHDTLEIVPADGGLHLCVFFKQHFNDVVFCVILADHGVTARPLSLYYRTKNKRYGLVLGFAGYHEKEMLDALHKIKKIIHS
jgi:GntR family transcriptional regulator / MocR family aminotransferase